MSGYTYSGSPPEHRSMESKRMPTNLKRQPSHPLLVRFKEAKKEITKIYSDLGEYISECDGFVKLHTQSGEDRFCSIFGSDAQTLVQDNLDKVRGIQDVVERNQMKCALFGRTSNGKSTVVNAMLGSRVLPSGIGHTTSCFLQVEGTDQSVGYVLTPAGQQAAGEAANTPRPVDSIPQLAHALSNAKLSSDALIRIYWPSAKCSLLREDVVLLDSPGVDIDPDMDSWIDRHCLDADLFILVANSESTLMRAEKKFFYKVSEKLSKPNIFVLNNRWDASAGELEYVEEVRAQHMERCVTFLADELKVCTKAEAKDRVFFISAKEALLNRANKSEASTPASPGPSSLADGWQARYFEFADFEKAFEKTLSESATRTKFASHSEQGREILLRFRHLMEQVYETSVEEKKAAMSYRQLLQSRLDALRTGLAHANEAVSSAIRSSLSSVEQHVSVALADEIRRLPDLVAGLGRPFHPEPGLLLQYKRDLNDQVERELGRRLADACAGDMRKEVAHTSKTILERYRQLISPPEARDRLNRLVNPTGFDPEFHVDCRNICADFREDLSFRFSLGFAKLMERFFQTKERRHSMSASNGPGPRHSSVPPSGDQATSPSNREEGSAFSWRPQGDLMTEVIRAFPSLVSRNTIGAVVVVGVVVKATGWRVLAGCGAIYGGIYLYERMTWTTRAKEKTFMRQYVDYASHKLRLLVHLTSTNAGHQAKQELIGTQKKLHKEVESCSKELKAEIDQLDADITRLDDITSDSKKLKNRANFLDNALSAFHQNFIVNAWSEC